MSAGGWIWNMLVMGTSFQEWPDGDPGALRELGSAWEDLANELVDAYDQMGRDASRVTSVWGGDAGAAFANRWSQFMSSDAGGPNAYVKAASQYAEAAINTSTQLEFAQLMCEIIVAITAAEVAIGLAFSEFGGEGLVAAAVAAGRLALVKVLEDLAEKMGEQILKEALEKAAQVVARDAARAALEDTAKITLKKVALTAGNAAIRGGLTFGGADLAAQEIQIVEGHRDGINWDMVASDAFSGAMAGAVGSLAGFGVTGLGRLGARALDRVADTEAGKLVTGAEERVARSLFARLPEADSLAGRALAAGGRWTATTGRAALVGGLVNVPTMAALAIAQDSMRDGSLVKGFEQYASDTAKAGWTGLGEQFAAGALGGGLRTGIEGGVHGARGLGAGEPVIAADPARIGALADGRITDLQTARVGVGATDLESLRARADAAGAQATVTGLRDLQRGALHQAAALPEGPARDQALSDASRYGQRADALGTQQAQSGEVTPARAEPARAEPALAQAARAEPVLATVGGRDTATAGRTPLARGGSDPGGTTGRAPDLTRSTEPARATGTGTRVVEPPSESGREPSAGTTTAHSLSPALAGDLHDLRAQHTTYAQAEATADASETAFRNARPPDADPTVRQANGTSGDKPLGEDPRPGSLGPEQAADPQHLAVHSTIWRDLAGGVRGDLTRSLDHVLQRPDLPADLRGRLDDVRTAYQSEGAARQAAARHTVEADRLADQALMQAGAGQVDAAIDSITASGAHTADAVHARLSALESRRQAEHAFENIPDPAKPVTETGVHPGEAVGPGEHEPRAGGLEGASEARAQETERPDAGAPVPAGPHDRAAEPTPDRTTAPRDDHTTAPLADRTPASDRAATPVDRGPAPGSDPDGPATADPPAPPAPPAAAAPPAPEVGSDPAPGGRPPLTRPGHGEDGVQPVRFPDGEVKILAFGAHADGTPLIERLSRGLGAGGDAVGLRVPRPEAGVEQGPDGPGVSVLGADHIPGVTGELTPLLRLDGLPGGSDVLLGDPATAGVADRMRDYAFPDAKVVQVVDRLPLRNGDVDGQYLDVLRRADLVVGVGDEIGDRLRELLPGDAGPGPRVETVPLVFEPRPEAPAPPDGPPDGPRRVRLDEANPDDARHAARVVAELRARGVDTRLEVRLSEPLADADEGEQLQRVLNRLAGSRVTISEPGASGEAGPAHLVLAPHGDGDGDLGVPRHVQDALESGQPLLVDGDSQAAGLLRSSEPLSVVPDGRDVGAWADRAQALLADPGAAREHALGLRDELAERYPATTAAARMHEALLSAGDGGLREPGGRVDRAAWQTPLNPRDVVLRHAAPDRELAPGEVARPSVVTVSTEFWSSVGGVATANRELTEAFAAAGADATGLVTVVNSEHREVMEATPSDGLRVIGVEPVWGVTDHKGNPDTRGLTLLPEGLPAHVDAIIGHSRFGGGVAKWLHENVFPEARRAHVIHTSPEVLDALKGDRDGLAHAQTERDLFRGADVAAGVGPLLGDEAARLSTDHLAPGDPAPKLHVIVPDMPAAEGDPPPRPSDREGHEILIQGRADDVIKSVRFGARLAADLASPEHPIKLVVRGAREGTAAQQHAELVRETGGPRPDLEIEIREFSTNPADLLGDLHGADLVLMPSLHEGFGLVATEATRAGKLVLTGEGTGAGRFFSDPDHIPSELGDPVVIRDGITLGVLRDHLNDLTRPDGSVPRDDLANLTRQLNDERHGPWLERAREALAHPDPSTDLRRRDFLNAEHPAGSAARELLGALDLHAPEPRPHEAPQSTITDEAAPRPTGITAALDPHGNSAVPDRSLADSGTQGSVPSPRHGDRPHGEGSAHAQPAAGTPGSLPQGLTTEQFRRVADTLREAVAHLGGEVVVQGSRATFTARPDSDIDIAVRVDSQTFEQLVESRFGEPNPSSAKARTREHAILTGKIQAGEAGLRRVRRQLQAELGMEVDLSIIRRGGPFDSPPFIPVFEEPR